MTRALVLCLALFCGKLMADPCDDALISTISKFAQDTALYETGQRTDLNGWTPAVRHTDIQLVHEGIGFNVLYVTVELNGQYPGAQDVDLGNVAYWITGELSGQRRVYMSTPQEIALAQQPPPPVVIPPVVVQPVVVDTDAVAMGFAVTYANAYVFPRSVMALNIESQSPVGFGTDQFSYIATISNGDRVRIIFQVDSVGNVTHISSAEIF